MFTLYRAHCQRCDKKFQEQKLEKPQQPHPYCSKSLPILHAVSSCNNKLDLAIAKAIADSMPHQTAYKISRKEHKALTRSFLYANGELYEMANFNLPGEEVALQGTSAKGLIKICHDTKGKECVVKITKLRDEKNKHLYFDHQVLKELGQLYGYVERKRNIESNILKKFHLDYACNIQNKSYTIMPLIPGRDLFDVLNFSRYYQTQLSMFYIKSMTKFDKISDKIKMFSEYIKEANIGTNFYCYNLDGIWHIISYTRNHGKTQKLIILDLPDNTAIINTLNNATKDLTNDAKITNAALREDFVAYLMHQFNFKALTEIDLLTIAIMLAEELQAAHDKNIIHGDIKPENIMIVITNGEIKQIKFTDWELGIPLLAHESSRKLFDHYGKPLQRGTPDYIAPEILTEGIYSKASDIFAFAKVLHDDLKLDCNEIPQLKDMMLHDPYLRPNNLKDVIKELKIALQNRKLSTNRPR